MRELNIAYGNNRQAKRWVNKTIRFDNLKERLKVTIRTTESAEEYAKMSRAQRDAAKDHGGFVAGVLKGGRRKVDTVESRSMVALDGDRIDAAFLDSYESLCPYASALYTTHSSTEENPRVRLVFPLTRDVTPEEFVAVSRYLAQMLGIDYFDECSYQPNQLMYWPSTPANGSFVYKETDGGWLDPDAILTKHPEWTDPTRLPTSSRESKANTTAQQKVQDPLTKEGVVGLFNRTYYPISKALETFLSDVYEPTDNENRWHLIASSSMAGVEIKEDKFVYSHHAKDPAYLKLCNAFDIVRIHRFGDLDEKASYKAMCEFAMQQDEVKLLAASERMADVETDFSGSEDTDWQKRFQYEPRSTVLKNNLHNITLILQNDPQLQNIVFNQQLDGMEIKGDVPWKHPSKYWRDADDAQLISYVDSHYGTFSQRNYQIAVTKVADDRSYHPIREYLAALPEWDGVPRVDALLIDYLGAEDNSYVRAVTRKTLCAAVRRVQEPGVKFDTMLVLNGPQGIGKSTLISRLAGEWFSDSLNLSDTKDKTAAEKLQGYWILEIGELAGLTKPRWRRCAPSSPVRTISTAPHSADGQRRIQGSASSLAPPTPSPAICGIPRATAGSGRSKRRAAAQGTPGSSPMKISARSGRRCWCLWRTARSCIWLPIWRHSPRANSGKRWSPMSAKGWCASIWKLCSRRIGTAWICSTAAPSSPE